MYRFFSDVFILLYQQRWIFTARILIVSYAKVHKVPAKAAVTQMSADGEQRRYTKQLKNCRAFFLIIYFKCIYICLFQKLSPRLYSFAYEIVLLMKLYNNLLDLYRFIYYVVKNKFCKIYVFFIIFEQIFRCITAWEVMIHPRYHSRLVLFISLNKQKTILFLFVQNNEHFIFCSRFETECFIFTETRF